MVSRTCRAEPDEAVDIGSDEADVARAALERIELAHRGQAHRRVDGVEPGEQCAVARRRGHRRVAVVERQRGGCPGIRARDDLGHFGPRTRDLIGGKPAQIAARHGLPGDDVGLARGGGVGLIGGKGRARPARDQSDVKGEVGFGQFGAERGDDPRERIDRAVARAAREHPAAVAAARGDGDRPVGRRTPRDRAHVEAAIARESFEIERGVGALACRDQIGAGQRQRLARILLVAGENDFDVGARQCPRGLHRTQRRDHHHVAALVVADPGPAHVRRIEHHVFLKRRIGLEHRVEVPDQQQPLAPRGTAMDRDQVARAPGLRHRDPAHGKAQRLELGPQHLIHRAHPGRIARPAVLIDHPLKQRERASLFGIDRSEHDLLARGRRRGVGRSWDEAERGDGESESGLDHSFV